MLSIARVTIKDWILKRVVTNPLIMPASAPMLRTSATVGSVPSPARIINEAAPTAQSASTAPTDRSMPPIRMTSVMPMAMMPFSEAKRTMLSRLLGSRKMLRPSRTGENKVERIRMAISPK